MKFTTKFILLSFLFVLTFKFSNASHIVGGELSYQCVGSTPGIYIVEYKWYRDCQGIPMCGCGATGPVDATCSINLDVVAADGNCAGQTFAQQKLTIVPNSSAYDVIQLCAMSTTICSNCGTRTPGSFTPGMEIFTFRGTVNLNTLIADPTCCKFNIGFSDCCRNAAITTFLNPGGLSFYSGGTLNKCMAPCNSAPAFTNDPVAITCAGQEFTYNLGAIDPDGDSLSYAFGQSLTGAGVSVPYAPPYTANIPFPVRGVNTPPNPTVNVCDPLLPVMGFCIDPITGDIRFYPNGALVANLVIEVKQWKYINGVPTLAGITRRDVQFYSITCAANNPPLIKIYDPTSGLPITANKFTTKANTELCLIIAAADGTKAWDTTDLKWNNPNIMTSTGATFKPLYNVAQRNVQGPKRDSFLFCWTPPADKVRSLPYYFVVNAKDRMCPLPARTSKSFAITVQTNPQNPNNIASYTIQANSGSNGNITPSGSTTMYTNSSLRYLFYPDTGYKVDSVIVDGLKIDSLVGYTFSGISSNHTIKVTFSTKTFNITVNSVSNGTVTPQSVTSNYGSSQRFIFTPHNGFLVDSVIVDGVKVDSTNGYTFSNLTSNHSLRLTYRIDSNNVSMNFPSGISYQAIARDSAGRVLTNTSCNLRFSIRENSFNGNLVYSEIANLTTNKLGLFTCVIGQGNAIYGNYKNIDWLGASKYLQIELEQGNVYVLLGNQQLLSVPYANLAKEAIEASKIKNALLPVYPNNSAALQGGLLIGNMYRTSDGILMIVY
jgi:hypothetical protein